MIDSLQKLWHNKKLSKSILISSNDEKISLLAIENFIQNTMFQSSLDLKNNPDFYLLAKDKNIAAKSITIEQVRMLQEFINLTPNISNFKVTIIYQAHFMTLQAMNACLKLLEEAPGCSYIFLITDKIATILDTIKSRCSEFYHKIDHNNLDESYYKLIDILSLPKYHRDVELLLYVSDKNRDSWYNLANNFLLLCSRTIKKSSNIEVIISKSEEQIFASLSLDTRKLLDLFNQINHLIIEVNKYDLDLRMAVMLLLSLLDNL